MKICSASRRGITCAFVLAVVSVLGRVAGAAVLAPAAGAVSAQTLSLPDKPGSVRGLADPASENLFSGQISYSVPIALPTGRAGFGPSLALTYSGELGNGPTGVGWTLGTIAIRRTLRE